MDQVLDLARALDDSGFYGMAFGHHLVNPAHIKAPYPYTEDRKAFWDPSAPHPDVWVTAAAIGQVTTKLVVGPCVFILPMHDVFTVAKAVSTAAYFMDGRLVLGAGAGWMEDEFLLTGRDFHTRGRHMDEQLVVLRKLFEGGMTEHDGEFYRFDPLRMEPLPGNRVPMYVGGHSRAAVRRAAQADGWFAAGPYTLAQAMEKLAEFRAVREELKTLDRTVEVIVPLTVVPTAAESSELAAGGATGIMIVPALFDPNLKTLDDRRRMIDNVLKDAER
jgi:alkanesulfonate monooxygenase SsuD/methylene tetrahydromethanopterin reductase-like flavin-dependent oxidoreductase (luciferase family)